MSYYQFNRQATLQKAKKKKKKILKKKLLSIILFTKQRSDQRKVKKSIQRLVTR